MEQSKSSSWKCCATCLHWCGKQTPDTFCSTIKYDSNERAKCVGGGWNGCQKSGNDSCPKWEQRFKR